MPKIIIILSLILMMTACNGVGTKKKAEGLETAIDEYVAALRWGRFDKALEYHFDKEDNSPDIDTSKLEYIKVTEHTFKKKVINDEIDEAALQLEVKYYHEEYGTVKKIIVDQVWWYKEETESWLISSEFPKF
jgi:hypothetical protein